MRALLKKSADPNAPQPDGATALHWAVHWDDHSTAEVLIKAGARLDAVNDLGVFALSLACANGSGAMVEAVDRRRRVGPCGAAERRVGGDDLRAHRSGRGDSRRSPSGAPTSTRAKRTAARPR